MIHLLFLSALFNLISSHSLLFFPSSHCHVLFSGHSSKEAIELWKLLLWQCWEPAGSYKTLLLHLLLPLSFPHLSKFKYQKKKLSFHNSSHKSVVSFTHESVYQRNSNLSLYFLHPTPPCIFLLFVSFIGTHLHASVSVLIIHFTMLLLCVCVWVCMHAPSSKEQFRV